MMDRTQHDRLLDTIATAIQSAAEEGEFIVVSELTAIFAEAQAKRPQVLQ